VLETLLRVGGFRRAVLLLRAADGDGARRRLVEEVLASEAFADLDRGSIEAMLARGQLVAVAGDLDSGRLDAAGQAHWSEVDTVVHCAASVSFEEPLDEIVPLNSLGPVRLLESLREAGSAPHFVHVSTAYAADCRQAVVPEDGPRHPGLADLDPQATMATARSWRAGVEAESPSSAWQEELARKGRRYAMEAGWPDTYALTKALGERLLTERSEATTIVRPTIIESALRQPRPGWLEGIKVADPLILAYAARGLTHLPGRADNLIDIVPVDQVANACVAAAAYPPRERLRTIAVASSSRNPLTLGELADQIKDYFRREPLRRRDGSPIEIGELRFVDRKLALRKTMRRSALAGAAARAGTVAPLPAATERKLRRNGRLAAQVTRMVKIYGPYTELSCAFDDRNARALAAAMDPADRELLPFDTATVEWEDYLQAGHLPAVHRLAQAQAPSPQR